MKLIVNIDCLQTPLTGIGRYTQNLLRLLLVSEAITDIKGVAASGWLDREQLSQLVLEDSAVAYSPQPSATDHVRRLLKALPGARSAKRLWQGRIAQRNSKVLADYLYWEPNFNLLPLDNTALTTVHDLSYIHYPQYHPKERVSLLHKLLPVSIERAQRVIAVSEFTRDELLRHFAVAPQKIVVISPAAAEEYRPYSNGECEQLRQRYSLPVNYVLSVGTIEPRKNLLGLVTAFAALPADYRDAFPLVLVGAMGWHTEAIMAALAKLEGHQLIMLGYIPQSDLPMLVAAATVMAYPSFYEGFGMPVVEAMAAGTPVLASNCSALSEVSDGAAVLVDPNDDNAIAEGLQQLLSDESLRRQCRDRGLLSARRYCWQLSAGQLHDALSAAAGGGNTVDHGVSTAANTGVTTP